MITFKQFLEEGKPKNDVILKKVTKMLKRMDWQINNSKKVSTGSVYIKASSINTTHPPVMIRVSDHKWGSNQFPDPDITVVTTGRNIDYDKIEDAILSGKRGKNFMFGA